MINPAFMHRCLDLASLGRGRVGNGALVGAILVRGDTVIAEGYHRAYGETHAERALLEGYTGAIDPEDVLYVNLEPCCHHGKTPPCTDVIIDRGVKTVVYGMQDPDQRVAVKGLDALRSKGITLIGNVERASCEYFNKGYRSVRQKNRPWITIKMAKDRAGSISKSDGSPLKITSEQQDIWSHGVLRALHDAILVGIGTILSDNPLLSRRFDQSNEFTHTEGLNEKLMNEKNSFQPYKIVLDPTFKIPVNARVIGERTIICVAPDSLKTHSEKMQELQNRGVMVLSVPLEGSHFEWKTFWDILVAPAVGYNGVTSILVEGGAKTWQSFAAAGMVDEEITLTGQASS